MFGKTIFSLLLLVPLGTTLLSSAIKVQNSVSDINAFLWGLGILFSTGPLLALLFMQLYGGKDKTQTARNWAFFVQKTASRETTRTIETAEPTTLEFQEVFKKLLSIALSDERRRLIVVLDNLDRITSEESAAVWAMLRSFIDNPAFAKEDWFKRLWVVIPYAPGGTATIKQQEDIADSTSSTSELQQDRQGGVERLTPTGERFLEKVIQIRFYVPSPVLSSWKEYLFELLRSAFESADGNALHRIYLLYASEHPDRTPGPRELVTLVNDIVATELQWQGLIPLEHQALFVMKKRQNVDIRQELIDKTLPTGRHVAILGPNIGDSLAALNFNVDVETASQILVKPLIKEALTDISGQKLKDEYKGRKGFAALFDVEFRRLVTESISTNASDLLKYLVSLHRSQLLTDSVHESPDEVKREIARAISAIRIWPLDEKLVVDAIQAVAAIDSGKSMQIALSKSLEKIETWNPSNLRATIDYYAPLIQCIAELRDSEELNAYFGSSMPQIRLRIMGGPQIWMEICSLLRRQYSSLELDAIVADSDEAQIFEALDVSVRGGMNTTYVYDTLSHYVDAGRVDAVDRVIVSVGQRLSGDSISSWEEMREAYRLLIDTAGHLPVSKNALDAHIDSGWLLHNFHEIMYRRNNDPAYSLGVPTTEIDALSASLLFVLLKFDASGDVQHIVGNSGAGRGDAVAFFDSPSQHQGILEALAKRIKSHCAHDLVLRMAIAEKASAPLAPHLALLLIDSEQDVHLLLGTEAAQRILTLLGPVDARYAADSKVESKETINRARLLLEWTTSRPELAAKTRSVLEELVKDRSLVAGLVQGTFDAAFVPFYIQLVQNTTLASDNDFVAWMKQSLLAKSNQELATDLASYAPWIQLIKTMVDRGVDLGLEGPFREALKQFANTLLTVDSVPDGLLAAAPALFRALSPASRRGLIDELYELTTRHTDTRISRLYLAIVGEALLSERMLSIASNKAVRRLLLPLLGTADEVTIDWIRKAMEDDRDVVLVADEAARRDFKEKLQQARVEATDSMAGSLDQLIGLIESTAEKHD